MSSNDTSIQPYAAAIRKLLKGVVYHDDAVWSQIRDYELPIRDYLGKIGLGLHLDEIGGFAYLFDLTREEDTVNALPALTIRNPLSFRDTVLLVLLRERYDEYEMRDIDNTDLILSQDEIAEMLNIFMGDHPDARKIDESTKSSISRLKRYGFLTERRDGRYQVRPLIRAKVGGDELTEIKARLQAHLSQIQHTDTNDGSGDDEDTL